MNSDDHSRNRVQRDGNQGFFASLLLGLAREVFKLIVSFALGTGAGAIVCWYYGVPLALSILGGILVLGVAIALSTESLFF